MPMISEVRVTSSFIIRSMTELEAIWASMMRNCPDKRIAPLATLDGMHGVFGPEVGLQRGVDVGSRAGVARLYRRLSVPAPSGLLEDLAGPGGGGRGDKGRRDWPAGRRSDGWQAAAGCGESACVRHRKRRKGRIRTVWCRVAGAVRPRHERCVRRSRLRRSRRRRTSLRVSASAPWMPGLPTIAC